MNEFHINPSTEITVRIAIITVVSLIALQFVGCAAKQDSTPTTPIVTTTDSSTLAAKHISLSDEPSVASNAIEPVWQQATALTLLAPATNGTSTSIPVTLRSVYSDGNIFVLAQYDDATQNMLNLPLRFKGGDFRDHNNWALDATQYEDGFSFMFEMAPATAPGKTFVNNGCAMACHATTTTKWDRGMFAENDGTFDMWFWRSSSSNATGLAEDNISVGSPSYLMDYDDPGSQIVGYNVDNSPAYLPFYVAGGNNSGLDRHFFIFQQTESAFGTASNPITGAAWAKDDVVPTSTINVIDPIGISDFWDVKARGFWSNGKWTVKFKRALTTASVGKDIQFAAGGSYPFAFAIHNNNAPKDHYGVATRSLKLNLMK